MIFVIEENIESESSSSRIHPRVIKMSRAASSLVEKVSPILALYRQILRTHVAVLPEPMKTLGDKYVQSEFRQHLRSTQTTKEHWREFHVQWTTYLSQIRGDAGGVSGELDPEILANLPEDKKEQLRRLQEETSKPFSMEANKVEKDSAK